MPSNRHIEAKVVVLGTQGVGKTSIVVRYVNKTFVPHVSPTIGASFFTCDITVDSTVITIHIWDTAGQERFRSMAPLYYRGANGAILMYDITSYSTFIAVKSWVLELNRNVDAPVAIVLVGNKCDLEDQRAVDKTEALHYAASIGATFYETSALSNERVEEVFVVLAKHLAKYAEEHPQYSSWEEDSSAFPVKSEKGAESTGGACC